MYLRCWYFTSLQLAQYSFQAVLGIQSESHIAGSVTYASITQKEVDGLGWHSKAVNEMNTSHGPYLVSSHQ